MDLIKEILFISKEDAELEAAKVLSMSPFFYSRSGEDVSLGTEPSVRFSTLGASSYLDSPKDYVDNAEATNLLIEEAFPELMSAVKDVLGLVLDKEITDLFGAGRIGFHIFDDRANGQEAQWHIDMPFQNEGIVWEEPPTKPFSFTVPLRLPRGVGGLDFKEHEQGESRYLPYTEGNLYLSDGLFPHRIANPIQIKEGEHRVTLQGHGVFSSVSDKAFVYF